MIFSHCCQECCVSEVISAWIPRGIVLSIIARIRSWILMQALRQRQMQTKGRTRERQVRSCPWVSLDVNRLCAGWWHLQRRVGRRSMEYSSFSTRHRGILRGSQMFQCLWNPLLSCRIHYCYGTI
jgi:hypothetical protein